MTRMLRMMGMLCDQPLDEPYTRLHDEVSAGGDDEAGYRRPDRLDYELERDLPGGWRDAQPDWGRYVRQADSLPLADRQPPQRRRDPLAHLRRHRAARGSRARLCR